MDYHNFLQHKIESRSDRDDHPRWRLRALLLAAGLTVLGVVLASTHDGQAARPASGSISALDNTEIVGTDELVNIGLALPESTSSDAGLLFEEALQSEWTEVVVGKGDTLSSIFSRLGIHSQLPRVLAVPDASRALGRIHPGQRISLRTGPDGLEELLYDLDDLNRLRVFRTDDGFTSESLVRESETHLVQTAGTIESSLFLSGQKAGLSDSLIMELAAVFGWDIDFALDIREGDSFTVIYEELYREGEKLRNGAILAAEFVNQGRSYQAVRYTDPEGNSQYYAPDGRSMRKAFLRTPIEFSRISSRFGSRRHPVLNTIRQHKGVDYAAPTGTPIRAAGDGKVVFRGVRGGYGNTVMIQHGGRYTTLYAHMSKFNSKARVGARVRQGQIVGYVGKSGLATGPHLHYEFHVNGVHRNPLTVDLPDAEPLPKNLMADFTAKSSVLLAQIDIYKRANLALGDSTTVIR